MDFRIDKIRKEFPSLSESHIYFDNACVTLRPNEVIREFNKYYQEHPSCHQRSIHKFGLKTTEAYQQARKTVQKFLNAKRPEEIIFFRNTTEGINFIASGIGLQKGDVVLTTNMEHNSNLIPWVNQGNKKQVHHLQINVENEGINFEKYKECFQKNKIKLVSVFYISNVTGVSLPIKEMAQVAHDNGALFLLDAAQAVTTKKIDVQNLDVDFLAFSFHKAFGPSGMGAVFGKIELIEKIEPLCYGGETVVDANYDSFTLSGVPYRFEAGLQNYSGAMGGAQALRFIEKIGQDFIAKQCLDLNKLITAELKKHSRVKLIGPEEPELRPSLINFIIDKKDMGEISLLLDKSKGIMTRSGFHCCHSWYHFKELQPSLRLSLSVYNTRKEVEVFIETINQILKFF